MKTTEFISRLLWCALAAVLLYTAGVSAAEETAETAEAMYQRGVAYVKAGNFKTALKVLRTMQKEHPRSRRAIRGWEYIAVCETKLGNPFAAFEAYQKIWDEHKDFSKLSVITRNQMKIGDHYLKFKQYGMAVEIYSKILENAPYSEIAPGAQYSLAKAYVGKKDYAAAKIEFGKVIQNYPTSQLVDDAAFEMGYVDYIQSEEKDYDQTATANAIAAFRQFIHDFPSSPKADTARKCIANLRNRKAASVYRTAEFYENVRANKAAEIMYKEVIEQYPDSTFAEKSRTRLAGMAALETTAAERAREERKIDTLSEEKLVAVTREKTEQTGAGTELQVERSIDTPVIASTTETTVRTTPSKIMPVVPSRIEVERKQKVDSRVKGMLNDPAQLAELKKFMKKKYIEERRRSREVGKEWQEQKGDLLRQAKTKADAYLDTKTGAAVAVSPERTELTVTRTSDAIGTATVTPVTEREITTATGEWQPIGTDIDYRIEPETAAEKTVESPEPVSERELADAGATLAEDLTLTGSATTETPDWETKAGTESYVKVEYTADDESKSEMKKATYETVDAGTVWEALRSETEKKDTGTADTATVTTTRDTLDTAETSPRVAADDDTLVIDLSDTGAAGQDTVKTTTRSTSLRAEVTTPLVSVEDTISVSPTTIPEGAETLTISETVEETPSGVEDTVREDTPGSDSIVVAAVDVKPTTESAALDIRAETTVTPPPVLDDDKAEWIAVERLKEQQRAREARQKVEALRQERDNTVWEKRKMPLAGQVRTAKYDDEMKKELKTEYNIDILKREYAGIFYVIQQGDAARQRGMFDTAKQRYGTALDRLLELKKKAPTWESDIINYRIKYCRDFMRKLD